MTGRGIWASSDRSSTISGHRLRRRLAGAFTPGLEAGERNDEISANQTGCLLLSLSVDAKRATMHAFLCIAQSRHQWASAALHDAPSCTPPGPSLVPRSIAIDGGWDINLFNDVRLWVLVNVYFAGKRQQGGWWVAKSPPSRRSASVLSRRNLLNGSWSRTCETSFPGSATLRFPVAARFKHRNHRSPDRFQDMPFLLRTAYYVHTSTYFAVTVPLMPSVDDL